MAWAWKEALVDHHSKERFKLDLINQAVAGSIELGDALLDTDAHIQRIATEEHLGRFEYVERAVTIHGSETERSCETRESHTFRQ